MSPINGSSWTVDALPQTVTTSDGGDVSGAALVSLGGGAEKQIFRSSSIRSEAPTMVVSLCNKKQTTTTSSYGGASAE